MTHHEAIEAYILQHMDEESDYLKALYRQAHLKLINPRMTSGHLQGRLLKMLVQLARPKRVLEIGTFAGYSALCMAEGLEGDGRLYTFEVEDELEDFTRRWINGSQFADKIEFIIGDALEIVPTLGEKFDMVFIDGNKREYIKYYEMAMEHLADGGWILADNTLWDGHVIEPERQDAQTNGVRAFNDLIRNDERVEVVILPLRDGLTIIRKK